MSAKIVGKKTMQDVWNYFSDKAKKPNVYVGGTWGWKDAQGRFQSDCVLTIKACGWGVDDDITASNKYDYIAKNKTTMPDVSIATIYNNSVVKSTDMSKIPTDRFSFVYIGTGHIGIYNPKTKQTYEMCAGRIMGIRLMALNGNTYWKAWSTGCPYFTDSLVNVTTPVSYVYGGVDYSLVFDPNYYLNKYADLKKAFGTDKNAAFNHFCTYGMKECRQAIASFNVGIYKANYADLRAAFKENMPSYYRHYCEFGKREKRNATSKISTTISTSAKSEPVQKTFTLTKDCYTFWQVSQKFKCTVADIQRLNPTLNPNNLYVGQVIKIG